MREHDEELRDIIGPNGFVGPYGLMRNESGKMVYGRRTESWNEVGITEEDRKMIELCKKWIRMFTSKRKTINDEHGSYGLKHHVERWAKTYIYNGAFILAALEEGYNYKQDGPNAIFNMSFKKYHTYWHRCPDCGWHFSPYRYYDGGSEEQCPRCGAMLHWRKEGVIIVRAQ